MGARAKRRTRGNENFDEQGGFQKSQRVQRGQKQTSNSQEYTNRDPRETDFRIKFQPKTERQQDMVVGIEMSTVTIGIGPAGTGKTAVGTFKAAEFLHKRRVKQIILTRPIVEIGKTIGHLPGDVNEKYAPYLVPFKEHLVQAFGPSGFEARLGKTILPLAINFIQGHTWDDAFVLIDEAQNMTEQEMYMLLTRIGVNTHVVITGDTKQTATGALKRDNGLADLMSRLGNSGLFDENEITTVRFTSDDIVRSEFVKKIVKMYDE
jgi:phosphate starvation-inducible PhoH-like protein